MAVDLIKNHKSFKSTNAITDQYVFVKPDPSNAMSVILPNAGDECIGVSQDKPGAGDPTMVCGVSDVTKVLCAGSIAIGQSVACDGNGKAVAATSSACVLGKALSTGVSGFLMELVFQPEGSRGII